MEAECCSSQHHLLTAAAVPGHGPRVVVLASWWDVGSDMGGFEDSACLRLDQYFRPDRARRGQAGQSRASLSLCPHTGSWPGRLPVGEADPRGAQGSRDMARRQGSGRLSRRAWALRCVAWAVPAVIRRAEAKMSARTHGDEWHVGGASLSQPSMSVSCYSQHVGGSVVWGLLTGEYRPGPSSIHGSELVRDSSHGRGEVGKKFAQGASEPCLN